MLIVSQSKNHESTSIIVLNVNNFLQTQHAAELCALLASDFYGELPSVCF